MTANWQKWRLTVSGFLSLMRTQSGFLRDADLGCNVVAFAATR